MERDGEKVRDLRYRTHQPDPRDGDTNTPIRNGDSEIQSWRSPPTWYNTPLPNERMQHHVTHHIHPMGIQGIYPYMEDVVVIQHTTVTPEHYVTRDNTSSC